MDKLDELGLRKNTLVLFTGDNGTDKHVVSVLNGQEITGGKGSMTDAGTRVPLIANWPGIIEEGLDLRRPCRFQRFSSHALRSSKHIRSRCVEH